MGGISLTDSVLAAAREAIENYLTGALPQASGGRA